MDGTRVLPPAVILSNEVRDALVTDRAIVALETAVVSHGLPPGDALPAVRAMAAAVRAAGAVPAVCLVATGCLHIGAGDDDIAALAADEHREKASVRDLGSAIARSVRAGLTVSATLFAAGLAGIDVFATGGIGGVHLDATVSGDISTDLLQLGRTPVVTICSGAKSVLDIPRTLEFLETAGVPVFALGTDQFPAFYLRESGMTVPALATPDDVARVATAQWDLGYRSGLVVGNPIPTGEAIDPDEWRAWLAQARIEAQDAGIRGKEVTPYLLSAVAQQSHGRTVQANVALLVDNARVAGLVARALHS